MEHDKIDKGEAGWKNGTEECNIHDLTGIRHIHSQRTYFNSLLDIWIIFKSNFSLHSIPNYFLNQYELYNWFEW